MDLEKFEGAEILKDKLEELEGWDYDGNTITRTYKGSKIKYYINIVLDQKSEKIEHVIIKTPEKGRIGHYNLPQKVHDKVEKFLRYLISETSS